MSAKEAVSANRIHDQIQPTKTCLERAKEGATTGHSEEQAKALEARGHTIEWSPRMSPFFILAIETRLIDRGNEYSLRSQDLI
jgi:gamma-glutamyltranspeptidase